MLRRCAIFVLTLLLPLTLTRARASATGPDDVVIEFAGNCDEVTVTAEPGRKVNFAYVWLNGRTQADGGADVASGSDTHVYQYTAAGSWISQVRAHATGSGAPRITAECHRDDGEGDDSVDGDGDEDDSVDGDGDGEVTGDGGGDVTGDGDGDVTGDGGGDVTGDGDGDDSADGDGDVTGDGGGDVTGDGGGEVTGDGDGDVTGDGGGDTTGDGGGDATVDSDAGDTPGDGIDDGGGDVTGDGDGDAAVDGDAGDTQGDGVDDDGVDTGVGGEFESVRRLWGPTRIQTATAVSQDDFPVDRSAPAVVLARADDPHGFADALAGTPLAHALGAPMLITFPGELHPDTQVELQRVLPAGGTVTILGGPVAIAPAVEQRIVDLGYEVDRVQGGDRFATAVEIARELGDPSTLLLATGRDFADALAAGAAAAEVGGAILLTESDARDATTDAYLAERTGATLHAVGGPAARPYPEARGIVGGGRIQTAVMVAQAFFTDPTAVGIAVSTKFPDALTGGAHIARRGGPTLLTPPTTMHTSVAAYLCTREGSIAETSLYGGEIVIDLPTEQALRSHTNGSAC